MPSMELCHPSCSFLDSCQILVVLVHCNWNDFVDSSDDGDNDVVGMVYDVQSVYYIPPRNLTVVDFQNLVAHVDVTVQMKLCGYHRSDCASLPGNLCG